MSEEELKKWFWEKFNSCYGVIHGDQPKIVYMFYDIDFIRKSKFRILQGKKIVYPEKPSGVCLFLRNYRSGYLWIDYDNIWTFIKSNYNTNYMITSKLIENWFEEYTKIYLLTPENKYHKISFLLTDETKLKVLSPPTTNPIFDKRLVDEKKLKVLKHQI